MRTCNVDHFGCYGQLELKKKKIEEIPLKITEKAFIFV